MKNFLISEYGRLNPLFLTCALSILFVAFRMKLSHDLHYLFLVWNLFLALIPLAFAYLLRESKVVKNKMGRIFGLIAWLLFLPNAPYILTDLIHLAYSPKPWFAYDLLMILVFAVSGLLSGLISIRMVQDQFIGEINQKTAHFTEVFIFMLCGYGVYLGRFWRFNSWHLLTHPLRLLRDCLGTLVHPFQHWQLWLFTLSFGTLLYMINFAGVHALRKTQKTNPNARKE